MRLIEFDTFEEMTEFDVNLRSNNLGKNKVLLNSALCSRPEQFCLKIDQNISPKLKFSCFLNNFLIFARFPIGSSTKVWLASGFKNF